MKNASARVTNASLWPRSAERLLKVLPGVVSATLEGQQDSVTAVWVRYAPIRPVGEILESVRECLVTDAHARVTNPRFHAVLTRSGEEADRPLPHLRALRTDDDSRTSSDASIRLVSHRVGEVRPGIVGVEVRIAWQDRTFREAIDGRRTGSDTEADHLLLPASATLDAVGELLRSDESNRSDDVDLTYRGIRRLRTPQFDLVVVLVEALVDGQRVPLAGATSADAGVERASITAALQATNPLVAGTPLYQRMRIAEA